MCDETYNGWTNWETWNLSLFLDPDDSVSDLQLPDFIEYVKDLVYDLVPATIDPLIGSIIDRYLERVNYEELFDYVKGD